MNIHVSHFENGCHRPHRPNLVGVPCLNNFLWVILSVCKMSYLYHKMHNSAQNVRTMIKIVVQKGSALCYPVGSVPSLPGTYVPGTDVPRYLCSPVPMFPEHMFPGTYLPRYLCSPVPMFPSTYVPRYRCSPNLCSPVPMFPGTYVPRFEVNYSSKPPRLTFLSLQIVMIIVMFLR